MEEPGIWQRLARWSNKVWRVPTADGRRYFRGLFVIHVIVPESTPPPYCSHLNETRASRFIDVVFVLIVHQCQVTMKYFMS